MTAKIEVVDLRKAIKSAINRIFLDEATRTTVFMQMCKDIEDSFEWKDGDDNG